MSFPERLVDQSSMTRRQLESISTYLRVAAHEMKLKEAAQSASGGAVSVGSYYRTVSQARANLRKSLVSVLIGLWLGAIKVEDVRRLFELVGAGSKDLAGVDEERLTQVLGVLLDRMVV